jgi:hypothetical protein
MLTVSTLLLPLPRSAEFLGAFADRQGGSGPCIPQTCCTDISADGQHLPNNKADGQYLPHNKADGQHLPGNKLRQASHTLADSQHSLAAKVSHVR